MWLSILIVALIVGGLALGIGGAGPIGFIFIAIGIVAAVAKVMGNAGRQGGAGEPPQSGQTMASTGSTPARAEDAPEDSEHSGTYAETGHAHRGQEHMTG